MAALDGGGPQMSSTRTYWLDLFTGKTLGEFIDAGASVTGFRETRWTTVQKMKPGSAILPVSRAG